MAKLYDVWHADNGLQMWSMGMTVTNQTKTIRKATVQRLAQVFRDSGVEYTSAAAVAHVLRDHILIRDAIECQWSDGTIALRVADELQRSVEQ